MSTVKKEVFINSVCVLPWQTTSNSPTTTVFVGGVSPSLGCLQNRKARTHETRQEPELCVDTEPLLCSTEREIHSHQFSDTLHLQVSSIQLSWTSHKCHSSVTHQQTSWWITAISELIVSHIYNASVFYRHRLLQALRHTVLYIQDHDITR
jgi:hypothetical protein